MYIETNRLIIGTTKLTFFYEIQIGWQIRSEYTKQFYGD